jgi:hypothetical protein
MTSLAWMMVVWPRKLFNTQFDIDSTITITMPVSDLQQVYKHGVRSCMLAVSLKGVQFLDLLRYVYLLKKSLVELVQNIHN